MTSQQQLVCDNSTVANFKQWASAISAFFATAGWAQTSDTGQVNWSTISSVPGSGAYVYEIWQPNDGLTTFYVRMEYGNYSGQTNSPNIRVTLGTSTNGAGTITGFSTVVGSLCSNGITASTTQTECDFSGGSGRINAMLWRNSSNLQQLFAIERSVNSSGAYTSAHVTLITCGAPNGQNNSWPCFLQQSLVFGVGASPAIPNGGQRFNGWQNAQICVRVAGIGGPSSFNGSLPFDTVVPVVGYIDYPLTCIGAAGSQDLAEGVTFQVTVYSALRTYMPSHSGWLTFCLGNSMQTTICMRYD